MKGKLNVVVAGVLALLASSVIAQESIGAVKRSTGQVVIERGAEHVAPKAGTEVFRGDRVVTGRDGYVDITMRRAAPLTIGPDAQIALDRFAAEQTPVVERPAPPLLQGLASFLGINRKR